MNRDFNLNENILHSGGISATGNLVYELQLQASHSNVGASHVLQTQGKNFSTSVSPFAYIF